MSDEQEPAGPVIRDRRRIDPETGQVREPRTSVAPSTPVAPQSPGPGGADGSGVDGAGGDASAALAERTADLQRLQAEYLNYKRRVDRDREAARHNAIGSVLSSLLPVLDDIARAREHGELSGGFKAVAESLERTVASLGLQSFGEPGEPFDPRIHEALMHSYSDDVAEPVCQTVVQVGYRHGDRVLRPARVAVAEPPASQADDSDSDSDSDTDVDADQHGSAAASDNSESSDAETNAGAVADAGDGTSESASTSQ